VLGKRQLNSFIAGFIVGGLVFGKKTPINYQINLYILSRIITALVEYAYKIYYPERLEKEGKEEARVGSHTALPLSASLPPRSFPQASLV
jgi:hypothetical protein